MIFYPHFIGSYAADTKGLSPLEHGCYRLLMDHNYATEQPIPNDLKELYRIVGAMTPAERKAVEKVADKFFQINGDGSRHNKRVEKEIARAREKSGKAKASAERRWGNAGAPPDAERSDMPTDMRTHSPSIARQSHKTEESKASTAIAVEARGQAANVPDCPHEKLIDLYHEALPDCTRVGRWTPGRQQAMRARWKDEAAPNREKHRGYSTTEQGLAYWRRFFGWVAESKFLTGRAPGRDGKPPFMASLPWLVKSENFAKVIEGQYHRQD